MYCKHVYENVFSDICPSCGQPTHEINWVEQNKLHKEWLLANPDAKSDGWWSI